MATEADGDYTDAVDADTKEEEEALAGHQVNPSELDYQCLVWQPLAPDSVSAATMGWEPTRPARQLVRSDFKCSKEGVTAKLRGGLTELTAQLRDEMASAPSDFGAAAQGLDPTQKLLAEVLVEWAGRRAAWRQALPAATGSARIRPSRRLLALGTAGAGKTHTAKIAINEVRRRFRSFDSDATMAFAGVAAANLGSGAKTIDSIFHTNAGDAAGDLAGDQLDALVEIMEDVQMLVIDEVSTCGAAALEIVNRRMQQVARVLWRRQFATSPRGHGPDRWDGCGSHGRFRTTTARTRDQRPSGHVHDREPWSGRQSHGFGRAAGVRRIRRPVAPHPPAAGR